LERIPSKGSAQMPEMWWDNKFNLRDDGDTLEQLWWPLVSRDFPQYERFWIKHIVPLTNRIDPTFSIEQQDWVSFRSDPKIAQEVEEMAMAQYSTFYFLSRSIAIINYEPHLYMEDAFLFLDLAIKKAFGFLSIWREELSVKLGIPQPSFPVHARLFDKPFAREIVEYRNVITHASKIGKALKLSRDFIPKRDHLPQAEKSWRYVQTLDDSCFEDGRKLLRRLLSTLVKELGDRWSVIERAVESQRDSVEYRLHFNLDANGCIPGQARSR
jgi:hypothetical protein